MPTIAEAKEAADRGAIQQSRLMYETILQEDPHAEDAWLGLADVLTDIDDKKVCYNNILKINPASKTAKEGLRSLEPQHDPLRAAFDIEPAEVEEFDQAPLEEEEPSPTAETIATTPQQKRKKRKKKTTNATVSTPAQSDADTPTPILVAFGLALSVVVFAIGSGVVYFALSSLPRF